MQRVPWQALDEWRDVKKKLFSEDIMDLKRAYEIMLMWKARGAFLPAHIECTISIVQVLLQEQSVNETDRPTYLYINTIFAEESNLQLSFGTALLRFVNHVSAVLDTQGGSLYAVAAKHNIPDWVINLRHDVAHNSSLPPLSILHSAVLLAKQWLKENYWDSGELQMSEAIGVCQNTINKAGGDTSGFDALAKLALKAWEETVFVDSTIITVRELPRGSWKVVEKLSNRLSTTAGLKKNNRVKMLNLSVALEKKRLESGKSSRLPIRELRELISNIITRFSVKKKRHIFVKSFLSTNFLKSDKGRSIKIYAPLLNIFYSIDSLESLVIHLLKKVKTGLDEESEEAVNAGKWLEALAAPLVKALHRNTLGCTKHCAEECASSLWLELPSRPPAALPLNLIMTLLVRESSHYLFKYLHFASPRLNESKHAKLENLVYVWNSTKDRGMDVEKDVDGSAECGEEKRIYSQDDLMAQVAENGKQGEKTRGWRISHYDPESWRRSPLGTFPGQTEMNLELQDELRDAGTVGS